MLCQSCFFHFCYCFHVLSLQDASNQAFVCFPSPRFFSLPTRASSPYYLPFLTLESVYCLNRTKVSIREFPFHEINSLKMSVRGHVVLSIVKVTGHSPRAMHSRQKTTLDALIQWVRLLHMEIPRMQHCLATSIPGMLSSNQGKPVLVFLFVSAISSRGQSDICPGRQLNFSSLPCHCGCHY